MLQKAANEFHGRQGHGPPLAYPLLLAFFLLVSKSHITVLDRENAVVRECYTWQSVLSHFQELGPKRWGYMYPPLERFYDELVVGCVCMIKKGDKFKCVSI
jgi:hypothetical protein